MAPFRRPMRGEDLPADPVTDPGMPALTLGRGARPGYDFGAADDIGGSGQDMRIEEPDRERERRCH